MTETTTSVYAPPDRLARIKGDLLLVLVAALWGSGFIAQRVASQNIGPLTFNGIRFLLGAAILLPFLRFRLTLNRAVMPYMLLAGFFLFAGSGLQQAGIQYTTAGNAGFITGTYVVIVPFLMVFFFRQKVSWNSWLAAGLALTGALLLSTGVTLNLSYGDSLMFASALMWACHVIAVGKASRKADVLSFAVIQYLVCGGLNLVFGILLEPTTAAGLTNAWWTFIYSGIFIVALGFTLQAVGQKNAPTTDAAIILGTEAVFAALFGAIFLAERFAPIQLVGCLLIMVGIVVTQLRPADVEAA